MRIEDWRRDIEKMDSRLLDVTRSLITYEMACRFFPHGHIIQANAMFKFNLSVGQKEIISDIKRLDMSDLMTILVEIEKASFYRECGLK